MDQAKEFRNAAAHHNQGRAKAAWRYPELLREVALRYCDEQQSRGRSLSSLSGDLGVSLPTLIRWRERSARPPILQPVRLMPSPRESRSEESLTLVTPEGYRIEGLDPASAAKLLREIG